MIFFEKKLYFLPPRSQVLIMTSPLPDALSKEFMLKCLSVMSYEQLLIVSIVELIMLSRQQILIYNFHNMRVTWLFCHFFKLQVHILHGLENISIINIWKLSLVRCDVIFN